jgi:copper(I)-binding protein
MHLSLPARLAALLAVVVIAGACSSGSGSGSAGAGSAGAGTIEISGAWARTSPMVAGAGAAYMVIKNTGSEADVLVSASSPAAKTTEVHETYKVEESPAASMDGGMASPAASMDGGMGSGGAMMGMRRIESLEIPAGGTVELKPGSYHVMLIELVAPLKAGEKIDITLTFEKAGEIKVTAEVKDM